jgi:hypothetical protein
VGLLRVMSELAPAAILEGSRVFEEFKGALTEQYVLQQLASNPVCAASTLMSAALSARVSLFSHHGQATAIGKCGSSIRPPSTRLCKQSC